MRCLAEVSLLYFLTSRVLYSWSSGLGFFGGLYLGCGGCLMVIFSLISFFLLRIDPDSLSSWLIC